MFYKILLHLFIAIALVLFIYLIYCIRVLQNHKKRTIDHIAKISSSIDESIIDVDPILDLPEITSSYENFAREARGSVRIVAGMILDKKQFEEYKQKAEQEIANTLP